MINSRSRNAHWMHGLQETLFQIVVYLFKSFAPSHRVRNSVSATRSRFFFPCRYLCQITQRPLLHFLFSSYWQQAFDASEHTHKKAGRFAAMSQTASNSGAVQHANGGGSSKGYMQPIISSRLPEYSNSVAQGIRAAFAPNSFVTIASLGHTNDVGTMQPGLKAGHSSHTTFSDFAYQCSPFDLNDELRAQQRREHQEKMAAIAEDQPFFAGYSTFKAKFEAFGVEYISEPFDLAEQRAREARWAAELKNLDKPFLPPGVEKPLSRPTRAMLGDVMTSLFRTIAEDWPDVQPTICATSEDLIVLYFLLERVKSQDGLLTYMNNALSRNDAIIEGELRKVPEGWHLLTEDRHIMYALRPPWVRPRQFLPSHGKRQAAAAPAGNGAAGEQPQSTGA